MKTFRVPGSVSCDADVVVQAESIQDAIERCNKGEGEVEVGCMHKRSFEISENAEEIMEECLGYAEGNG